MKEIVTIDGKQFELMTEYPLTEQQRQQTISDIRQHTGCSSCDKTQSLDGSIQTLTTDCVNVEVKAPPLVSVASLRIVDELDVTDTCATGTCNPIVCSGACTGVLRKVIVSLANAGDMALAVYTRLQVREGHTAILLATYTTSATTSVPARVTPTSDDGTADVEFTGVALARGSNNVCADFSLTPYT